MHDSEAEKFARISIEEPTAPPSTVGEPTTHMASSDVSNAETPKHSWWDPARWMGWLRPSRIDPEAQKRIAPADGAAYRLLALNEVLEAIGMHTQESGYLDDAENALLRHRLSSMHLKLATNIAGALRLRYNDKVAVMPKEAPEVSIRSMLSPCLYIIAWVCQANGLSQHDMQEISSWLHQNHADAGIAPYAEGVVQWLGCRKLVFTRKRKLRCQRFDRCPKIRQQLVTLLLRLCSDSQTPSPKRLERLAQAYSAMGLNPANIHTDMHRLATADAQTSASGKLATREISRDRMISVTADTRKAQEILAGVFTTSDEEETPQTKPEESNKSLGSNPLHDIIRQICQKEVLDNTLLLQYSKESRMPVGAMLESINDIAYDIAGDPLVDYDGATATVDPDIANELRNYSFNP